MSPRPPPICPACGKAIGQQHFAEICRRKRLAVEAIDAADRRIGISRSHDYTLTLSCDGCGTVWSDPAYRHGG